MSWQSKSVQDTLTILFIGDVMGKPGMEVLRRLLPGLLLRYRVDFCIANGENVDGGKGLSPKLFEEMRALGVDVVTGGNHILYRDKILPVLEESPHLIRPFNYPPGTPGYGSAVYDLKLGDKIAVLNLQGRAFLPLSDCPFRRGRAELERLASLAKVIVVDFHAEATAEKIAFARYVDGFCSAAIGTHTHVQTADEAILPGGTAYITDVGMTGAHSGVIGLETECALNRFLQVGQGGYASAATEDLRLSAVLLEIDSHSGKALRIERLQIGI
ncbi:MAG: TIGR00282 family metallophosphoesterase [bacterium]